MLPIISVLAFGLIAMFVIMIVVGLAAWWIEEFPRE